MQALILAAALIGQVAITTPREAVGWAIAHQATQPAERQPLYRYVWIPEYLALPAEPHPDGDGLPKQSKRSELHVAAVLSYAINEVASQSGVIVHPERIANGWMLAVYLPHYASATELSPSGNGKTQLQTLVDVWDGLAVDDPYFHETSENSGGEVAVLAQHIDQDRAAVLAAMQKSPALVYRADWLIEQLTHLKYYEFAQFAKTQPEVYKAIGVNEQLAQEVEGDQRAAIFVSGVTGKPRRVDRLQGASGRFGTGAVWQTWDVVDEAVRVDQHPLYNLLAFSPGGGEAIFEKSNGLHGYIIYDAQRRLVREAAPELVADHTIPGPPDGPGSRRLVPAISCIRCHAPGDGLQPVANDVATLLDNGTDIFAEIDATDQQDALLRLAGLYAGDFGRRIQLGRDDYDLAVRRATQISPMLSAGLGASQAGTILSDLYAGYVYRRVDAAQACRELGYEPEGDPVQTLSAILPRSTPENVVIASLRAGIPVRRRDWEQVYAAAMARVQEARKAQP